MSHAFTGTDATPDAADADSASVATAASGAAGRGFVGALWHGDFGLPRTYWIAGALVGGAWALLFTGLAGLAKSDATFAQLSLVLLPVWMVYVVVALVGIWRAARRYQGPKAWAVLAQLAVVLGWMRLITTLGDLLQ